jgi:hypothetical protein
MGPLRARGDAGGALPSTPSGDAGGSRGSGGCNCELWADDALPENEEAEEEELAPNRGGTEAVGTALAPNTVMSARDRGDGGLTSIRVSAGSYLAGNSVSIVARKRSQYSGKLHHRNRGVGSDGADAAPASSDEVEAEWVEAAALPYIHSASNIARCHTHRVSAQRDGRHTPLRP